MAEPTAPTLLGRAKRRLSGKRRTVSSSDDEQNVLLQSGSAHNSPQQSPRASPVDELTRYNQLLSKEIVPDLMTQLEALGEEQKRQSALLDEMAVALRSQQTELCACCTLM